MKLQLLSLQVPKHLQCFRLFLLTLLLFGYMQTKAETWTDDKGFTWSFTVSGTEATDIRPAMFDKKVYIYGDPNRSEEEKAENPQLPFQPAAWDAAAMRFSSNEGIHLPTIPDDVYFSLKTLIFDVSDVSSDFDLKIMNGWWSNTYYDHVKWEDGLNEVPITQTMADECAPSGLGRDLDLMLYSGSMTLNAVYYQTISLPEPVVVIPEKVYAGSTELTVTSICSGAFSGCSNLTSVTIPEGVTSIGDKAFSGCSNLTSVTIPDGVTSIGDGVFIGCSNLTGVIIPEGVTSIGKFAFYGCSGLTSVTIPKGVNSIGDYAFIGSSSLTSVTIPETVTNIGKGTFEFCTNLTNVTIPKGANKIGDYAFIGCSNLTSVIIPEGVTSIGKFAFYGCSGLTSVTISEGVTSIGDDAFYNCSGLTSVTIPETVTSIGDWAFYNCSSLTNLTIPSSVTSIGDDAFYNCSGLTSITISEGVTSIGDDAFLRCSGLTSVTIPETVTSIGEPAFSGCSNLATISVESGNPVYDSRNNCNAFIETATNTLIAGCKNTIIPESVTSIGDYAFSNHSNLTSVTIPEGVTSIGKFAFYGCSGLSTVISLIEEPFNISSNVFFNWNDDTKQYDYNSATLYVPAGTKEKYEATSGWNLFQNILEMEPTGIAIDATNFPDENFRNWVLAQDYGQDGVLTDEEIAGVTKIDVSHQGIANLKGIEYFTALTRLECYSNQLTSLDMSENTLLEDLICDNNSLTSLNITKCTALENLDCERNQLTALDISNNTALTDLTCGENLLTSLDVSKNINLEDFDCSNNHITALNVSNNKVLSDFVCYKNMINGTAMDDLIKSLPTVNSDFVPISPFDSDEQNVITKSQVAAARLKGWKTWYIDEIGKWQEYEGSEPELTPVDEGQTIDIGNEIDGDTNLEGTVVDNVFVNISNGDGGFDPVEKCIIVNRPTDDSAIDGKDIFGDDFKDNYTGIVFKVNEGKGSIKVEAETQGNMVLKVKIGNSEPIEMELDGKLKVKFPYNVSEPTYVYIYGGMSTAGAKATGGTRASADADLLKIYGFEIVSDASGIEAAESERPTDEDAPVYNLNGQRVDTPTKGIYIKNGRKVLVK